MLHIYKPIGVTCGELVTQLRHTHNYTKIAFCGRLDPMAHGKMLCIYDDETKNTKQHLEHNKTYEFRFVIGLSTDTTDTMGLFNNEDYLNEMDINVLLEYINNIKINTSFPQKYHKFSSFTPPTKDIIQNNLSNCNDGITDDIVDGKMKKMPLWYWSSKGIKTKDYYKDVTIFNLEIISVTDVMINEIISEAITNIQKVTNQKEFRIPLILEQYSKINKQGEKSDGFFYASSKTRQGEKSGGFFDASREPRQGENKEKNPTDFSTHRACRDKENDASSLPRQGAKSDGFSDSSSLPRQGGNNMKEFRIRIKVSTGFYVRQFVQDLSDNFKVKMMVTEIFRSEIS